MPACIPESQSAELTKTAPVFETLWPGWKYIGNSINSSISRDFPPRYTLKDTKFTEKSLTIRFRIVGIQAETVSFCFPLEQYNFYNFRYLFMIYLFTFPLYSSIIYPG